MFGGTNLIQLLNRNYHKIPSQVMTQVSNPNTATINLDVENQANEATSRIQMPPTPVSPSPLSLQRNVIVKQSKKRIKERINTYTQPSVKPSEVYQEIFTPKLDSTEPLMIQDDALSRDVAALKSRRQRMSELSAFKGHTLEKSEE